MIAVRFAVRLAVTATVAMTVLIAALPSGPARAQGKLDARYVATLAGITIGKGAWVIDVNDKTYKMVASGLTAGLLRFFASGEGTGGVSGVLDRAGQPVAKIYSSTIKTSKKTDDVRMAFNGSSVKELSIDPPLKRDRARIPVTPEHRRNIIDPMTATMVRVNGTGSTLVPEACNNRVLPIFDGRMRYNLRLEYKRTETVEAERGYKGPALVCGVYFTPVAGHVPNRTTIEYLIKQRDIEIWLVPIAGTRLLVPFQVSVPTPVGTGRVYATHFVTVAQQGTKPATKPSKAASRTKLPTP